MATTAEFQQLARVRVAANALPRGRMPPVSAALAAACLAAWASLPAAAGPVSPPMPGSSMNLALALNSPLASPAPMPAAKPPAAAPAAPGAGGVPAPRSSGLRSQAVACLISPERVADIGSPVVGVVQELRAESGERVRAGQALVLLQSEVEQAGVDAAEARSTIDADERAAVANLQLARQRHTRAVELQADGFYSSQATEQARAELDVAAQKLEQARGQRVVAARELGVVRAQLRQRIVRSPFDGVVTERFINVGERVEDKPVMRLAMLNPLRVELVMPASRYGSVVLDERLSVLPELPGTAAVSARVTHVDAMIDAASNTFRVRLSLPNPGHKLPAGARCKLLNAADTATAPAVPVVPYAPAAPAPLVPRKAG